MNLPRLKALADALDYACDRFIPDDTTDTLEACREASALIRSLSDVEPVAWRNGILFSPVTKHPCPGWDGWEPLYLHPAVPLLDPPQAPAEGAADLLREVLGSLEHEYGATKVDRWFPEARAFIARSNANGPGPSQATPGQDEKSTREGVERDAARWREIISNPAAVTALCGSDAATLIRQIDHNIDAQIKTGEAPK